MKADGWQRSNPGRRTESVREDGTALVRDSPPCEPRPGAPQQLRRTGTRAAGAAAEL